MPRLNDHGLGGGGKGLGVPVYPLISVDVKIKDKSGTVYELYGENTAKAPFSLCKQASCVIGDEIYFIGTGDQILYCYTYNVKTRVWTQLANTPASTDKCWAVAIGSNIYYCAEGETNIYVYHTSNNTHEVYTSAPIHLNNSRATSDGANIYIFGGNYTSAYQKYAYKFDVIAKTFTRLTDMPTPRYDHSVVYCSDGYIYIFGGFTSAGMKTGHKYNTYTDTYTQLANIPINFYRGMIADVDDYIYLINSYAENNKGLYRYDKNTNTFTTLENTPNQRYYGHANVIENVIYMMGYSTGGDLAKRGESMLSIALLDGTKKMKIIRLVKNSKLYTNADVATGEVTRYDNTNLLNIKNDLKYMTKSNNVVTVNNDGEYILINGTYATIGG